MQFQTLFIIFVAIFVISAVLVFLGITRVIHIDKKYLNALFYALIIEVIAAIIYLFYLYSDDPMLRLEEAYTRANIDTTLGEGQRQRALLQFIEAAATLEQRNHDYRNNIAILNEEIRGLNRMIAVKDSLLNHHDLGQTSFFSNINTLEKIFNIHNRKWFWLTSPYTVNHAADIYPVINALINEVGVYSDPDADIDTIIESWRRFIEPFRSEQTHNISEDPNGHIQSSDILFLLMKKYQMSD